MQRLKYIEPKIVSGAELKIKNFYYTDTLSFSLSENAKKNAHQIQNDCVLFYFLYEDILLETIRVPLQELIGYEEVWATRKNKEDSALLFATDIFTLYSYSLLQPF